MSSSQPAERPVSFLIGDAEVYFDRGEIHHRAREVRRLDLKAMSVLRYLIDRPGQVAPKEDILGAVWPDTAIGEDVLPTAISKLRKALGDEARSPRIIKTFPKRGYGLIVEARPLAASPIRGDTEREDTSSKARAKEARRHPRAQPASPGRHTRPRGRRRVWLVLSIVLLGFAAWCFRAARERGRLERFMSDLAAGTGFSISEEFKLGSFEISIFSGNRRALVSLRFSFYELTQVCWSRSDAEGELCDPTSDFERPRGRILHQVVEAAAWLGELTESQADLAREWNSVNPKALRAAEQAQKALNEERMQEARKYVAEAKAADRCDAFGLWVKARYYQIEDTNATAPDRGASPRSVLQEIRRCIEMRSMDDDLRTRLNVRVLWLDDKISTAEDILHQCEDESENDTWCLRMLGFSYQVYRRDPAAAIAKYNKILGLGRSNGENDPTIYASLAECSLALQNFSQSDVFHHRYFQQATDRVDAHNTLTFYCLERGRYACAREHVFDVESALEAPDEQPTRKTLRVRSRFLRETGRIADARRPASLLVNGSTTRARKLGHEHLALIDLDQECWQDAIDQIATAPDSEQEPRALATSAFAHWMIIHGAAPGSACSTKAADSIDEHRNAFREMHQTLEHLATKESKHEREYWHLVDALDALDQADDARFHSARDALFDFNPFNEAWFRSLIAAALIRTKQANSAIEELCAGLEYNACHPPSLAMLGEVFAERGQSDLAAFAFSRCRDVTKAGDEDAEVRRRCIQESHRYVGHQPPGLCPGVDLSESCAIDSPTSLTGSNEQPRAGSKLLK